MYLKEMKNTTTAHKQGTEEKTVREKNIKNILVVLSKTYGATTMLSRFGAKWDVFQLLIATILSARSRDEVTEVIAEELFRRFPTPEVLAFAPAEEVKRIIHRIGFFNAKTIYIQETSRMIMKDFHGKVPDTLEELTQLPGVGRKVANCVLVYGYKKDAIPVDTHVHRISNRLGWVHTKSPEETEQRLMRIIPKKEWQAVNDTLVSHGKNICTPLLPKCSVCPVSKWCERSGVKRSR